MTWARLRLVASPALVSADQEPPMLCVSWAGMQPAWGHKHIIETHQSSHTPLSGFFKLRVKVGAPQRVLLPRGLLVPGA